MHERFSKRITAALERLERRIERAKKPLDRGQIELQVGRLLGSNSRAAKRYAITILDAPQTTAKVELRWSIRPGWDESARHSEGCYLLRTNVENWTPQEMWKTYVQLWEVEAAFRIHKSDLRIRPIWHQRQDRVLGHILVCFLAYVLCKTLAQMCRQKGLGDEPRRVADELSEIRMVDVVLPTSCGREIRRRCITQPSDHQAVLLQRLGLSLPSYWPVTETRTQ